MARRDGSTARAGRKAGSGKQSAAHAQPMSRELEDLIDQERGRLMKAHSILSCAVIGMEGSAEGARGGPYWPDIIELANEMIDESIRKLEVREPAPPLYETGAPVPVPEASLLN